MRELKNTSYQAKVAVIGSRDQLCVHPDVTKLDGNTDKVQMCRSKVHNRSCQFYNKFDGKKEQLQDIVASSVLDIEDLAKFGSAERMCPYYMARELKKSADIIFMPYNYILDVKNRRAHGVDLQGAIVIIDEAHNIEKVCEDSASFDLSSLDLSHCLQDIDRLIKIKKGEADEYIQDKDEEELNLQDLEDLVNLKKFFLSFEEQLDLACSKLRGTEEKYKGRFIFELFAASGVTYETAEVCMGQCERALSLLSLVSGTKRFHSGSHLQKFLDCLKIVFSRSSSASDVQHQLMCNAANYRVYLKKEPNKKKQTEVWTVSARESSKKDTITLSYWCFSPGHSMKEVMEQGVRCVILTSGTLSPIDSFSSELRVDFPVVLQNPHVITSDHIWISVVSRGPDQTPLNSSYSHRSEEKYQNSLGNALVNFARIVPNGMLVFFPSYFLMNDCVSNWENNGILDRLRGIKDVYTEPRRKDEFQMTMDSFYAKVNDPGSSGAVFMAVCRGKVSEGLDFADNNGRAVVITGLPYPPRMDPKVTLKMEYLKGHKDLKCLNAEEWYKQQASRAVNQAIGRVIRHRNDFGAILLCDERFNYRDNHDQLPKWIKPHVRVHTTFGMAQRELNEFFKCTKEKFGCHVQQAKEEVAQLESKLSAEDTGHISYKPKGKRPAAVPIEPKPIQSLDIHVPSMVGPSHGSLPKIKLQFEEDKSPLGFFEALSKTQSTALSERYPGLCGRQAMQTGSSHTSLSQTILGKRPVEVCVVDGRSAQSGRSEDPTPPPPKKTLPNKYSTNTAVEMNAKVYEADLRQKLSSEALKKFTSLVAVYKKNRDFLSLKEGLEDLFRNPSLYSLLRGFVKYIRKEHKDAFNEFCYEFTGQSPVGQVQLEGLSVKEASAGISDNVGMGSVKGSVYESQLKEAKEKSSRCNKQVSVGEKTKFGGVPASTDGSGHLTATACSGTSNLSTSTLDSVTLLNGGKELLGNHPDTQGVERPSLKSRVSGKICIFCGKKAIGPHKAKCGHTGCYECWMKDMKRGMILCSKCNSEVKKKELKRVYLV
jgi:regulator of telomere elongation helicase 1